MTSGLAFVINDVDNLLLKELRNWKICQNVIYGVS